MNLLNFTKMQAYGNDYIYIIDLKEKLTNLNELARKLTNRHFGIGSDGLVLICPSSISDFKMRIFNPDGTEAEMCGNALRSVGKLVFVKNLTTKTKFTIETKGGIKNIELKRILVDQYLHHLKYLLIPKKSNLSKKKKPLPIKHFF